MAWMGQNADIKDGVSMIIPAIEEIAKPVAVAEEEHVIALVVDVAEGQMDAPMMDIEEDLAVIFGDEDFEDDTSDEDSEEEVWAMNKDWLMALTTPPPVLAVPSLSVYEVGGPSTMVAEGPSFPHVALRLLVSYAKVAAGVTIEEIGSRVYAIEGQVQVIVSQMVQTTDRMEQIDAQVELGQ
ncbi:hypothetical protein Tco_0638955 [Tanacetum coccineum]